jgi:metallophosphoesterase superfamily enzyme
VSADRPPPPGAVGIVAGGVSLALLAQRAVWLADSATLLVADVHLGKAATFRRLGVPVPETTTGATLAQLGELVDQLRAQRLFVLGDLLHGPAAQAPAIVDALAAWRDARPALAVTLVRGNHDARAGDPPAACGIALADEPLALGALRLRHAPPDPAPPDPALPDRARPDPARPGVEAPPGPGVAAAAASAASLTVVGHLHPACRLRDRAGSLRLPCFWLRPGLLVLPAFGEFTGAHEVEAMPGDRLFPIADGRVFAMPGGGSAGRAPARRRPRGS